jgi:hypothetical protein
MIPVALRLLFSLHSQAVGTHTERGLETMLATSNSRREVCVPGKPASIPRREVCVPDRALPRQGAIGDTHRIAG